MAIEAHLVASGYTVLPKEAYDVERAFFPDQVLGFIRETQAEELGRIETMLGDKTDETLLKDLNFWLNSQGMLPVITAELKNPMTGQTVENAIRHYKKNRDHRELLFEFRKRALVHFAVDTELAYMRQPGFQDRRRFSCLLIRGMTHLIHWKRCIAAWPSGANRPI